MTGMKVIEAMYRAKTANESLCCEMFAAEAAYRELGSRLMMDAAPADVDYGVRLTLGSVPANIDRDPVWVFVLGESGAACAVWTWTHVKGWQRVAAVPVVAELSIERWEEAFREGVRVAFRTIPEFWPRQDAMQCEFWSNSDPDFDHV